MSSVRLEWNGGEVLTKVRAAALRGIDATTAAGALRAMELAPRDTGHMADTIETQKARQDGDRTVGLMGNWTADYSLWVEVGTRRMAARPFLRPAADSEWPKLAARIAGYLS